MTALPAPRRSFVRPRCARGGTASLFAVTASTCAVVALTTMAALSAAANGLPLRVVGDGIPESLDGTPGDAARGRALLAAREAANCVLCHAVPAGVASFAGELGPSLAGVGARLSTAQLRLRVADNRRLVPQTIMPSYHRVDGLHRVASAYAGKPILTAREVEDVVAYLGTLR